MSRISKDLMSIKDYIGDEYIDIEELKQYDLHVFIDNFLEESLILEDNRHLSYTIHSLEEILMITILGVIANCNTFVEIHIFAQTHYEWLKEYLSLEYELPAISTFKRVIAMIKPDELEKLCNSIFFKFIRKNYKETIFKDINIEVNDIVSIDGKTANSSNRNTRDGEIVKTNAMSAYSMKYDKCIATEFIQDKTNEISTAPILLSKFNIKNSIITFDALNTQTKTIDYIVNNGGYYVAPVKGNQFNLFENITAYFDDKELFIKAKNNKSLVELEKSHNQIEKRTYIFTNDIDWIYKKSDWVDLKSIGIVIKEINGKVVEKRYFISNLEEKYIELMSKVVRNEWMIENKLHYFLDTVFKEDDNSSYLKNSQKNLNIIRKFCLSVLKIIKEQSKLSMNSIRFKIGINFEKEIEKLFKSL